MLFIQLKQLFLHKLQEFIYKRYISLHERQSVLKGPEQV